MVHEELGQKARILGQLEKAEALFKSLEAATITAADKPRYLREGALLYDARNQPQKAADYGAKLLQQASDAAHHYEQGLRLQKLR